tara:strand:- start:38 stop:604 length:567 start_codon:yes stop_codon:yes gene_type:complete
LLKKKSILFFLIIFFLNNKILVANDKLKIIDNINSIETLKFSFTQISFDKEENGICFLKRPHFLKCEYKDKIQKELIINRKNLVIYHKKYNRIYFYPVRKSYFSDILDKKKFEDLLLNGVLSYGNKFLRINYFSEKKGKIIFSFDKKNFNLSGWEITDFNGNPTNFEINNLYKNIDLDKKLFSIPLIN